MQTIVKEIAFPKEEYARRIANVRAAMQQAEVDCLLVTYAPNVCYLSGFKGTYSNWHSCLVVPLSGEVALQVCEHDLALLYADVERIEYVRWDVVDETAIPELAKIIGDCAGSPKRIGVEMRRDGLPPHRFDQLRSAFHGAEFVDLSDLVLRLRRVKSDAEVAFLRKSGEISVIGFDAAVRAVKPGCNENDIAAATMNAMIVAGSEVPSTSPFIRGGVRSSVMHATWRRNPIATGDSVVLEIGGTYERYSAPLYGTVVLGKAPAEVRRLYDFCRSAVDIVHSHLRPGRAIAEVARAAGEALRKLGPDVSFVERHGYCVGIGFPPDWVEHSLVIAPEYDDVLEPGMVFHTPRSLRVPGSLCAGYSDTVVVTASGCENLTPHSRELIEV